MNAMLRFLVVGGLAPGLLVVAADTARQPVPPVSPATPVELVATYDSLAVAILGAKKTEENLVWSILATTHAHAQATLGRAQSAMESGQTEVAQSALEELAGHVALLGTEGDNAVAAVRKRLLEGGHHHHAEGESKGVYDPGFVVVTKDAKMRLLEASRELARLSRAPNTAAVARQWEKVEEVWSSLVKAKKK